MDLTNEDTLRLNVLLAQKPQAVRIDESRMEVHALTERGEAKVVLHATGRDEKYLRNVRQWLSTQVLGSPGGYPVFLRRWTRMGQARDDSLEKLLLLGEPEAIVAVVHASGLTNELAKRAWWCAPNADNARCMLESQDVVTGSMGPELAQFLVEFLPFEESSAATMRSVRLVLQGDLVDQATKESIWQRGKRKNTYFVGFLQQCPECLPIEQLPHADFQVISEQLSRLEVSNPWAQKVQWLLSGEGQAMLETYSSVMKKPSDQDVVVTLFNTMGHYFTVEETGFPKPRQIEEVHAFVGHLMQNPQGALHELLQIWPQAKSICSAIIFLSMVSESLLDPVFGVTDAIGTVMRKRIAHLIEPIQQQVAALR